MFLFLSSIESEAECTSRLYRTIKPIVILRLTVLDRLQTNKEGSVSAAAKLEVVYEHIGAMERAITSFVMTDYNFSDRVLNSIRYLGDPT